MRLINKVILISSLLFFITPFSIAKENMHVVFINPDPPESPFWGNMTTFMQAVAKDLDIQFDVIYGDRSRFKNKNNFMKAITQENKPDYIITIFQESTGPSQLSAAEAAGVKVFVINTDIPSRVKAELGSPREKYSSWIGHLWPDDKQGGELLAKTLLAQRSSLSTKTNAPFKMFGISGSHESSPALYRNNGIKAVLSEQKEVQLEQIVYAQWGEQEAYKKTNKLLQRYPDTSLIFCAGGAMTSGVIKAIQESAKTPGEDLLLGSFDWSESNISKIKSGTLAASVGGHFMDGGWSLILLYDYHHGIDFKDTIGVEIHNPLSVITLDNVNEYQAILKQEYWQKINFKKMTKTLGGTELPYNLTIDALGNNE